MLKHSLSLIAAFVVSTSPLLLSYSAHADGAPKTNKYWWPKKLDLTPLRQPNVTSSPMGKDFNYAEQFNQLDLNAVVTDIKQMLTTSQDWWPADYGNYGPFFIRMSWHAAGTYRIYDGRGGAEGAMQRFAPLNSWPDNVNLDKARRLLWPIKQKYGDKISWSDLMVLTGTVAIEQMGVHTIGFAGGRIDAWEPQEINWGTEDEWMGYKDRQDKNNTLKEPYAATHMGLIYVNPEGPEGKPDPLAAAKHIRETFARMAMNDEETVALIAGGHTFGKAHGAAPSTNLGPPPEAAPIQLQGLGWENSYGTGKGDDTITSGLEGAWSVSPIQWSNSYFQNLFGFNWVKTTSPGGAIQWTPDDKNVSAMVPDAHDPNKRHAPIMFTTDLSLKFEPAYQTISKRFQENPKEFELAFAKAWFKLTHRDMGPRSRYLGSMAPKEAMIWQDPVPAVDYVLVNDNDIAALKTKILSSGLTGPELIRTAWNSASSFRGTDKRGGANGARIRLMPEKDWPANNPAELVKVLPVLEKIQNDFNQSQSTGTKISLADLIILGGNVAIEEAAKQSGHNIKLQFNPGRTDASQDQTDVQAFAVLEPKADGFINYFDFKNNKKTPPEMLVRKAKMLNLTIPEMTVLVGGMRALNANYEQTKYGVFTDKPGTLSNDYFINLLDMNTLWKPSASNPAVYEGFDQKSGQVKWQASAVDLIFGSNSELRAVAEVYASADSQDKFITDFSNAWVKVMNLDRFDLAKK